MASAKKDAIKILQDFKSKIDPILMNQNLIDAIDCALSEIGKCGQCLGTGEEIKYETNGGRGYKVRVNGKGTKLYIFKCGSCDGGKVLSRRCVSCGEDCHIMSGQMHVEYCQLCENRLKRTGVLNR